MTMPTRMSGQKIRSWWIVSLVLGRSAPATSATTAYTPLPHNEILEDEERMLLAPYVPSHAAASFLRTATPREMTRMNQLMC